jgi:hypothetical protein
MQCMCMCTSGHTWGTFPSTHGVLLGVLSGQVGTHGVLSRQVGTHEVLSGQVGRYSRGTASAPLRHCAWYSRRARTCAHAHSRAADYVLGPANTNACPAGYSKITTAATCQAAAAAVLKPYGKSETHPSRPGGCFLDNGNPSKVEFNTNATGAAFVNAQPLCRFGAPLVRVSRLLLARTHCVLHSRTHRGCSRGRIQY